MKKILFLIFVLATSVSLAAPTTQDYARLIDAELNKQYSTLQVAPLPFISDEKFVRRAYLNIVGRIPTYNEYEAYTKITSPDKKGELIRYLVNSPGYTSHLYNFWSDILRVRTRLNNTNFFSGEPYIKWIKDSITKNIPYTQFVKDLLLSKGDYYTNPATGYYERDLGMPLCNFVATNKVLQGIDIGCAQCHDDPFQEWTQKQFYEMAAFFYPVTATGRRNPAPGTREKIVALRTEAEEIIKKDPTKRGLNNQVSNYINAVLASVHIENKKLTMPHDYKYSDMKPNQVVEPKLILSKTPVVQNEEDPRIPAVNWMTSPDHPTFTKNIVNRYWKWIFGKAIIDRVDNILDDENFNSPLMNTLVDVFKKLNYNSKEFIRVLCSTELFSRDNYVYAVKEKFAFIGPVMHRLSAEQMWDSILSFVVENPEYYLSTYSDRYVDVMNIPDVSALGLMNVIDKLAQITYINGKKYEGAQTYKSFALVRASDINDQSAGNNAIAQLGRSDRELIGTSSTEGSVTQVISLVNGQLVDIATKKDSHLMQLVKGKSPADKTEIMFKAILSRKPTITEKSYFVNASEDDLIWALINTNEFKFSN